MDSSPIKIQAKRWDLKNSQERRPVLNRAQLRIFKKRAIRKIFKKRTKFTSTVPGRLYTLFIKSNENKRLRQWCFVRYSTMATYNITYE